MYPTSKGQKLSTHFIHFLSSRFTLYLIKAKTNCIKVISDTFKVAIVIHKITGIAATIIAISGQTEIRDE
jgi:hypothetical protein